MNTLRVLTLRGTDNANRDLTFRIVALPAHGALSGLNNSSLNSATINYMPATDYLGSDSFTFQATNGISWSTIATFSLNVSRPTAASQSLSTVLNAPITIRLLG